MSNIVINYRKVLETIEPLFETIGQPTKVGRKPKMSDIEVVALSLTAEYMSIDSENAPFERLKGCAIQNLLERSQFNKRRRILFELTEKIRKLIKVDVMR